MNTDSPLDEILSNLIPHGFSKLTIDEAKQAIEAYCHKQVIEKLEKLLKTHKELGMWSNMREIVEKELAELRKTL